MRGTTGGTALVVAASASILSRSLARGGWTPSAIDGFGDEDTLASCAECQVIPYGEAGFDPALLQSAIDRTPPTDITLYGGGLDSFPAILGYLAERRGLLGNTPDTVRLIKTPRLFFGLLTDLGIPFPETRFDPPKNAGPWLSKTGCSEGGAGVGFAANPIPSRPDTYFQRRITGNPMSALFLANGNHARIIGFNTLWTSTADPRRPFLFAGAINRAALNKTQRDAARFIVDMITGAAHLRGLNSLDFMTDADRSVRVLEVNPRPSATMALYDDDFPTGLARLHCEACDGRLPEHAAPPKHVRAFRIVYAPHDVEIAPTLEWPQWCRDRPRRGCRIEKGGPICTIVAEGPNESAVLSLIEARAVTVTQQLLVSADSHGYTSTTAYALPIRDPGEEDHHAESRQR
jgi:uncharacterized protein